ncbi:serine/threonine protein phosphatase 2A regulatory subunit B beta isoform-like protein isoform X1 [Cinnamomum micranthum f. kanehirae]|uniref:Serine/threonine protein phosphatase 2A regulatory subunit B beta isoform-like protein isoform X1 n=1 Tax=Cinnamomum micranthum f. kanehirae TaxID=337451 RepID=A0A443N2Q0_9MAGN|nr:serine/threonine protein phosphatase 2A regulatory subunit B beta isoform-like protein isoform X1 [Cinnamomum micranthum f. kanehirae]
MIPLGNWDVDTLPPLEWKFSEIFGERAAGEEVHEVRPSEAFLGSCGIPPSGWKGNTEEEKLKEEKKGEEDG